ncbi:dihydrofolate reductase family protein [Arthrobacter sp. BE255]|uniref:dihydrofolate reductase family protein n=1 Tax=Arthrobacter sp. BE255 TaxID=2817721 RepID=UPI002864C37C|nr:dihydrofolate reductase family protein [Arthrobacter sp. BE255]MDR7159485.1 dihydrofolate reductase [Arthrobacter sp. BE255]
MRTVTYSAACSLDGYIAGSDGSFDWLYFSPDVEELMGQFWSTVDAVLMGRKTWEFSAGQDFSAEESSGDGTAADLSGIPPVTTYLFSRTLPEAPDGVELVTSDGGGFVNRLKQQPGKGIFLMGGGELATSLFEAGAIDVVSLNVHPVLLGSGVPFFRPQSRRIALELTESRAIDGGCVLMTYRVRN